MPITKVRSVRRPLAFCDAPESLRCLKVTSGQRLRRDRGCAEACAKRTPGQRVSSRSVPPWIDPQQRRGLNTDGIGSVELDMKAASLLLAAFTVLAAPAPPATSPAPEPGSAKESRQLTPRSGDVRRAIGNMESWVRDLRARNEINPGVSSSAGNLWMEVNQLRNRGADVRRIEWYVSDLEASLRMQQDASARRHILNNLELEMQNLKRRAR